MSALREHDLTAIVSLLKRRARVASDQLTAELEAASPAAYEAIYWLACGVSDYLAAYEAESAQVDLALDILARIPMESGLEIGELIEERRGAAAAPSSQERTNTK